MSFINFLSTTSEDIHSELKKTLYSSSRDISLLSPRLETLFNTFSKATTGGKVIRGTLVCLGYTLAKKKADKKVLSCAVAFEILHTALLAHDDVIDQSEMRRGKPSLYKALGNNHYGISQTICLGDLGFFLANELIGRSDFSEPKKNKALLLFSQTVTRTILGEMLDVELAFKKDAHEKDVLTIHTLKTAFYTITAPLTLGYILGDGSEEKLRYIEQFGDALGVAFQIYDDILGIYGSEVDTGKSSLSDITEGKNTLLYTYTLENGSKQQRGTLKNYYGTGTIDEENISKIKKVFKESGAYDYSFEKATEYTKKAQTIIPHITENHDNQLLLRELTEFLLIRKK